VATTPRYADLLARLDAARTLGVELGLPRVRRGLALLGDPQRRFAAVQVAGTNGKGSVAAMTEAILRAAGVRTGLYTSPHLSRFTERIRVAGAEADGDHLAALDARVAATGVPLTYFEIATALAFLTFAEEGVEVAVLETGLGGRLDAVTTCEPLATAVTSIGLDHLGYLGATLREIAREKAGVIKPGVPHLVGPLPAEADEEQVSAAEAAGAPLLRLDRDFQAPEAPLGLPGAHQRANAALAVELARRAAAHLGRPLPESAIAEGLATVRWPGRLERIGGVLLDCAHNVEGARALAAALPALAARPVTLVTSIVADKDAPGILSALAPAVSRVVTTRSGNARAIPPEDLAGLARKLGLDATAAPDPRAALDLARRRGSLILVAGSIFLVGELRAHLLGEPVDPTPTSDPV
jgi:dihydrofolate synthase/folylpolyglutamate synthase